jgi:hypothetical protein
MTTAQDVLADASSGGSAVLGILFLVALIAAYVGYNSFKTHGFRQREVTTQLSPDELAAIFEQKVCGMGWTIVDRGNPLMAQSSLIAGIRQQIALQWTDNGDHRVARIWVPRYSKKVLGGATKAYTLRMRMGGFLNEVRRRDAAATVAG